MAGFDDLLAAAQPYLDYEEMAVTAGTTWVWSYLLADNDGNLVDLTAGYTGTVSIRTRTGTSDVVAVAVTFPAPGAVTCKVASAATTAAVPPGNYFHELTLVRTSDSATLIVVGADDSTFVVKRKVTL